MPSFRAQSQRDQQPVYLRALNESNTPLFAGNNSDGAPRVADAVACIMLDQRLDKQRLANAWRALNEHYHWGRLAHRTHIVDTRHCMSVQLA